MLRRTVAVRLAAAGSLPCLRCGQPVRFGTAWELDHRVPIAAGGPDTFDNLGPSHAICNRSAHANLNHWGRKPAPTPSRIW